MSSRRAAEAGLQPGHLCELDVYTWAIEQAGAVRDRRAQALDWNNLAEEVEIWLAAMPTPCRAIKRSCLSIC